MKGRKRALVMVGTVVTSLGLAAGPAGAADAVDAEGGAPPSYRMARNAAPVRGSAAGDASPRLLPGAHTYKDSIKPGEKKYYSVDLDAVSNAYISAVAVPRPGTTMGVRDGIDVSLQTADGMQCGISRHRSFLTTGGAYPVGDYADRVIKPGGACQTAGTYHFVVQRGEAVGGDAAPMPVELKYASVPPRKQRQPATPTGPGPTAPSEGSPSGAARGISGGTGFNDAPTASTGVWTDVVRPGETRFYRVPVGWGQRIYADAEFGPTAGPGAAGSAKSAAPAGKAYVINGVRMGLNNTERGYVANKTVGYQGRPAALSLDTVPAEPGNASGTALAESAKAMRFAGSYYLQVSVNPKVAEGGSGAVPVTLRIDVTKEDKPRPTPGAGAGATSGTGAGQQSADADGQGGAGAGMRAVGYAGVGTGSALLVWIGGWRVVARRRAAARQ
ncbi:hypothetical protein AB0I49_33925 [Streptomyces sp. NPDC050617]|uniref:hypothetical protein n=1 Tax=Streptomyces sp. NPDC050617 TaxID=3154628 RepID=UPI00341317C6